MELARKTWTDASRKWDKSESAKSLREELSAATAEEAQSKAGLERAFGFVTSLPALSNVDYQRLSFELWASLPGRTEQELVKCELNFAKAVADCRKVVAGRHVLAHLATGDNRAALAAKMQERVSSGGAAGWDHLEAAFSKEKLKRKNMDSGGAGGDEFGSDAIDEAFMADQDEAVTAKRSREAAPETDFEAAVATAAAAIKQEAEATPAAATTEAGA